MTQLRARIRTKLRRVVRRIVYFPLSPSVFKLYASLLRRIGAVRGRNSVGRSPERILISHLYCNLGDFILTIPLIDSLNKHFPSYAVDIAIDKKLAEFCKVIPGISGVYPFEPGISRVSPINPYLHVINQVKLYWKGLRHVRYSMCIVPRWGDDPFLSQHLAYLSSAPQRYGYSSSVDRGDSSRDSLLSKSSVGGSGEHEVLRELRLLNAWALHRNAYPIQSSTSRAGRSNYSSPKTIKVLSSRSFLAYRLYYRGEIMPLSRQDRTSNKRTGPRSTSQNLFAGFKNNMRFILLLLEVQTKCSCAIQLQMLLVVLLCRLQE